MDHVERVCCAFAHRESDKVPKGEFVLDRALVSLLEGEGTGDLFEDTLRVLDRLKVDLTGVRASFRRSPHEEIMGKSKNGRNILKDGWGAIYLESEYGTLPAGILECPIKSPGGVYGYEMPPLDRFEAVVDEVKKWAESTDYFVFANVWGPLSGALTELMGWENYMIWSKTNLAELKALTKEYTEYQAELAKRYVDAGAHGILIAGDLAGNDGPFLSPNLMRELVFPFLKAQVAIIKDYRDVPIVYHSDGNINTLMEDIVNLDIDGINPLEPHAGMDLGLIKRRYGNKLCLLGNVDTNYVLPQGTPQEVEKEVKRVIDIAHPGGGFILQSANMLTPDVPVANIFAMFDTAENYRMRPNKR